MFDQKLQDAFNEQIKNELYSGYLYLAMAAYCESQALPGFAHWMKKQAREEQEHALKFYDFVHDHGGRVVLHALEQPPLEYGTPLQVFQEVYAHEQKVTALIHHLYELAVEAKDYAAQIELHWFITEQVEEEKNAVEIIAVLERIGESKQGLVMLDHELAGR